MVTLSKSRRMLLQLFVGMFSLLSCFGVSVSIEQPCPETVKNHLSSDINKFYCVAREQQCPEAGTFVLFAKVMNEVFAPNYVGCTILTEAQFVATGKGAWYLLSGLWDEKGYVVVRALPTGQQGQKNPLSGELTPEFVMVPLKDSDAIFSANVGDILELRGGTIVVKYVVGSANYTDVVFFATSAKKK